MKRFQLFSLLSLTLLAVILSACQSGGGYKRPTWQYSQPTTAKAAPSELGGMAASSPEESDEQMSALASKEFLSERQPMIDEQNAQMENAPAMRPNLPPVKVALLVPLSGRNAKLGEAMLNAAQIALFDVGHNNFELIPVDTHGTASGARNAAQTALNQRAELVLGPVFAGAVKAAQPIIENAGINMIAFTTDWSLSGNNTFIMGFLPFDQVERITRYAAHIGIQDIAAIIPSSDYGDAVYATYQNSAFQAGLNPVQTERFSPQSSSLSTKIRSFAKYDERRAALPENSKNQIPPVPFDAIFMPVGGDNARAISTLAMQYDLQPKDVRRIGTGLMDDSSLATEPAMEGAIFAAPSPKSRVDFQRHYFETYGISPPRLSTLAYDATALAAILARTGLQNGGKASFNRAAITNPNGFAGIDGIFRFRPNGLVERGLAVLEYKNGTIIMLDEAPQTFQQNGF